MRCCVPASDTTPDPQISILAAVSGEEGKGEGQGNEYTHEAEATTRPCVADHQPAIAVSLTIREIPVRREAER